MPLLKYDKLFPMNRIFGIAAEEVMCRQFYKYIHGMMACDFNVKAQPPKCPKSSPQVFIYAAIFIGATESNWPWALQRRERLPRFFRFAETCPSSESSDFCCSAVLLEPESGFQKTFYLLQVFLLKAGGCAKCAAIKSHFGTCFPIFMIKERA